MEILIDRKIRQAIADGLFGQGFDPDYVQPASYDLRIGPKIYDPTLETPDKSFDVTRNGGGYTLPRYGLIIVETYETLTMPRDYLGRIGLQSRLARKGVLASCGPQVDPGFDGKLFVTLQNCTNAAQAIGYLQTFLTIEFIKLDEAPDRTYQGPYQHRKSLSPDVLADLVRFEGPSLSQMQREFGELRQHVKEWSNLAASFDVFLRQMSEMNKQGAENRRQIEELTKLLVQDRVAQEPYEIRNVSAAEAEQEILEHFRQHKGENAYYSDVAEALKLSLETVVRAFESLKTKGLIEEARAQ